MEFRGNNQLFTSVRVFAIGGDPNPDAMILPGHSKNWMFRVI